jgi:hypothetical protein
VRRRQKVALEDQVEAMRAKLARRWNLDPADIGDWRVRWELEKEAAERGEELIDLGASASPADVQRFIREEWRR